MNLYFIYRSYRPGEASTNRALSYFYALSYWGVKANVVYLLPDKNNSKVKEVINGIDFLYFWDHLSSNNQFLSYLFYLIHIIQLLSRLKKGDKVYIYDNADLLEWLLKKRGISIYYEVTEHPLLNPPRRRTGIIPMNRYYDMCKRLDGLFVISSALKTHYVEQGICEEKITIINMTVDENRFAGLEKNGTEPYFAYCGTVLNDKDGVDQLIKAFALFHKKYPDIKLKIIGRTPPAYAKERSSNEALIKELNLEEDIILTGQVPSEQIPQLLKNAIALVLARPNNLQAKYGFPTKLGEYLLTENPVVVTEVGDIPLFLTDNESAYIAKPDDIEGICSKLCIIVENPSSASRIGKEGANVARKCFNNVNEMNKMLCAMNVSIGK